MFQRSVTEALVMTRLRRRALSVPRGSTRTPGATLPARRVPRITPLRAPMPQTQQTVTYVGSFDYTLWRACARK